MRRLASQSRDDSYATEKDYQELHRRTSLRMTPAGTDPSGYLLSTELSNPPDHGILGIGGYVAATTPTAITFSAVLSDTNINKTLQIEDAFSRFGIVTQCPEANYLLLGVKSDTPVELDLWGITAGWLGLSDSLPKEDIPPLTELQKSHLAPETFYLQHDSPLQLELDEGSSAFDLGDGRPLEVKKCSYCCRYLPVDMDRLGALAFHKHQSKKTLHQNECRACKKWRINDWFNELRTADQLHESAVITRERKLFLREPEILQAIKKRTGEGLKSQTWKAFNKRCFKCDRKLTLEEVELDHTRPLAYLWPIDEHATCLCPTHNNEKGDKFPVDYYTEPELRDLSDITGLSYEALSVRDVNEEELHRILDNLPRFATEWTARTFAATARKVQEMRSDIDLLSILADEDIELAKQIKSELSDRPAPVVTNDHDSRSFPSEEQ